MRLRVDKLKFQKAISKVEGVISSRDLKSQLSNILFETDKDGKRLFLTATDLEIDMKTGIECDVEESGEITLPARKISQIIKAIPGDTIELSTNDAYETVILDVSGASKARFAILGLPQSEFPTIQDVSDDALVEFPNSLFVKMLKSTSYAIAEEDSRFVFNGLYMVSDAKMVTFVATDGKRLSKIEREFPIELGLKEEIIVPYKAVREMLKILEPGDNSKLGLFGNHLFIKTPEVELRCNLIEGQYPNFNQVIPQDYNHTVSLSRDALNKSVRLVSVMANEQSKQVKLTFSKENLSIVANTPEVGEADDSVYCDYQGEDVEIGFNYDYVLEAIQFIENDDIRIGLNDNKAPLVIRDKADEQFVAVIMPMKL